MSSLILFSSVKLEFLVLCYIMYFYRHRYRYHYHDYVILQV